MTFDKRGATFLLKLVQERPAARALGSAARHLAQAHGIGLMSGAKALYASQDYQRAAALLRLHGIDPNTAPDAWQSVDRTAAGLLGGNEKWSGKAVSTDLVAVACLQGRCLEVAGAAFSLPAQAHLVLPVDEVGSTEAHSTVVVVENFASFRRCSLWKERYLSQCGENPLFVYRGDKNGTRASAVYALLKTVAQPVLAACDMDPAGLGIALTLPRLDGIVAPSPQELEQYLKAPSEAGKGRSDLFARQYAQWAALLDASSHSQISPLWTLIRRHGQGVIQELFLEYPA